LGERLPPTEFLIRLQAIYGTDLHWLLTGESSHGHKQAEADLLSAIVRLYQFAVLQIKNLLDERDNLQYELLKAEERMARGELSDEEDPHHDDWLRRHLAHTENCIDAIRKDQEWARSVIDILNSKQSNPPNNP
jgi:hypothetical protein